MSQASHKGDENRDKQGIKQLLLLPHPHPHVLKGPRLHGSLPKPFQEGPGALGVRKLTGPATEKTHMAGKGGVKNGREERSGRGREEAGKRKGPSWLKPAGQQGPAEATLLPGSVCL